MKDLFIYHPGTGTMISLSDVVYICNTEDIDPFVMEMIENGSNVDEMYHKGYRIDNYNMTRFFYGD